MIVDDAQAHQPPTLEQSETYHGHREAAIEAQRRETRRYDEERKAQMAELYKDKIGKKREGKKKAVEQHGTAATSFEVHVPDLAPGAATTNPPAAVPKPPTSVPLSSIPYTIIIQPSSTDMSWHDPSAASYTTLAAAKEAGVWNYPTTPLQESRCRVFEDLWSKGFFMGGGLRFGGDFLVYPGALVTASRLRTVVADLFLLHRRSITLPLPLYPHRPFIPYLFHHATRSRRVRSTGYGRQEGSLARKLGRKGGPSRLSLVGMGSVRLRKKRCLKRVRLCIAFAHLQKKKPLHTESGINEGDRACDGTNAPSFLSK